jgi:protein-disulfide isomerase-like protein with CxxC motif
MSNAATILRKHFATLVGLVFVAVFIVIFLNGRRESKPLHVVATRVGLKADDLAAMVPRISSQTGATIGTSRRLVYLMACSGVPTGATLEAQTMLAAGVAEKQGVTPREAATSVLGAMPGTAGVTALRDC